MNSSDSDDTPQWSAALPAAPEQSAETASDQPEAPEEIISEDRLAALEKDLRSVQDVLVELDEIQPARADSGIDTAATVRGLLRRFDGSDTTATN
jgi:hypothetical protein